MLAMHQHNPTPPAQPSTISPSHPSHPSLHPAANSSASSTPYLQHQQLPNTAIPSPSISAGNASPLPPTNGAATATTPLDPPTHPLTKAQTPNPPGGDVSPKLSIEELKRRQQAKGKQSLTPLRNSPALKEEDAKTDGEDGDRAGSPMSKSGTASPQTSPKKRPTQKDLLLDQYVNRDLLHAAALSSQSHAHLDLIRSKRREVEFYKVLREERRLNPSSIFGLGYQGYGNAFTDGKTRILYPVERKRPGGRRAREIHISRANIKQQAETPEDLVPIRLDINFDKIRLRDTFTWNLHDRCTPIELFAENLVEDFHLPISSGLVGAITRSIMDQVTDYHPHAFLEDAPLDPQLPYSAYKNDEMRVLIKINITIGNYTLIDQFEWDINNPQNSPEEFAQLMTKEMSLSGEFCTAIAHSIREQAHLYSKYLYFVGYPFDGRPIEDDDLRNAMLPSPLGNVLRPANHAKDFTPLLWEIPEADADKQERTLSKEAKKRQKRRLNRRGGPTLPDIQDVPKTHRSQIVSSILPGAVEKVSDMRMYKDKVPGESETESSDSEPPSPQLQPQLLPTMTRRAQRNAAVAAASALRNSAARSATPEISVDFHTPTRHSKTSANQHDRRPNVPPGADSLVVKLKLPSEKLAAFAPNAGINVMRMQRSMPMGPIPGPPMTPQPGGPMAMMYGTPGGPPPPAPDFGSLNPGLMMLGPTGQTSVPVWLENGLALLRQSYPNDQFEGIMRQVLIDSVTGNSVPQNTPMQPPGRYITDYTPRIRCVDCPGKLYTPGPGETVDNFEIHLKNRIHRERVEGRLRSMPFPPQMPQ